MGPKLRIAGKTISFNKTYNGDEVMRLLRTSYDNGYQRAVEDLVLERARERNEAYKQGYKQGSQDLNDLRKIIKNLIEG